MNTRIATATVLSMAGIFQSAFADMPPPVEGPGIETQSGQALYQLPRDHAWHGGDFYQTNDYNEWHYITAIGEDVETGERVSVFLGSSGTRLDEQGRKTASTS